MHAPPLHEISTYRVAVGEPGVLVTAWHLTLARTPRSTGPRLIVIFSDSLMPMPHLLYIHKPSTWMVTQRAVGLSSRCGLEEILGEGRMRIAPPSSGDATLGEVLGSVSGSTGIESGPLSLSGGRAIIWESSHGPEGGLTLLCEQSRHRPLEENHEHSRERGYGVHRVGPSPGARGAWTPRDPAEPFEAFRGGYNSLGPCLWRSRSLAPGRVGRRRTPGRRERRGKPFDAGEEEAHYGQSERGHPPTRRDHRRPP